MKRIPSFFACLVSFSLIHAQTIIPEGEVSGLWKVDQSPFHITGNIHIPGDTTLIIEPGVEVLFQGHYQLKVEGRLLAEGTAQDTILFSVSDTTGFSDPDTTLGGWYGIRIYDNNSMNDSTKLAYCRLEYGKAVGPGWFLNAGGALCVIEFDKVAVSNCLFTNNSAGGPATEFPAGGAVHLAWSDVTFTANTFSNNYAYAGGAIQFHESNPVFRNNVFHHNRCKWDGGAISAGGSYPSFSGDTLRNNHSDELGGGMNLGGGGRTMLEDVTVVGNSANWGGGIGFQEYEAVIQHSTISDNRAGWLGGGIAADGSVLTIRNSTFEKDSSGITAGGIHTWQGTLKLEGVSFKKNSAWQGGAVHSDWSTLMVDRSEFMQNSTTDLGGALKVHNSHLLMDSCLLDGNHSLVDAGAIDYIADTLVFDSLFIVKLSRTRISGNLAGRGAGGLSIQQTHDRHAMVDLHIDHCEISGNRAHRVGGFRIIRCPHRVTLSNSVIMGNRVDAWTGGGSFASGSVGQVYNCVFYNNQAATVATAASTGGFGATSGASVDVINCTFVANSAGLGGGITAYRGGKATVSNTLLWYNTPEQLALNAVLDSLPCHLVLNYNDIQYGPELIRINDTVSSFIFGDGNINTDPLFVNVGQADFRLMDNSPAIGSAMDSLEIDGSWLFCPPTDMAGIPRPSPSGSRPDMGAFEHINALPVGLGQPVNKDAEFLIRSYPNPFKDHTTLEFCLIERCNVTLDVYDLLGKKTEILRSVIMDPGIHRVDWTPAHPDGHVYFYLLKLATPVQQVHDQVRYHDANLLRATYLELQVLPASHQTA